MARRFKRKVFKNIVVSDPKNSFEDAVYQYLIDHGTWNGKKWRCEIYFEDQKDFRWRVKARLKGIRRNDENEARKEHKEFMNKYFTFHEQTIFNGRFENFVNGQMIKPGIGMLLAILYRFSLKFLKKRFREWERSFPQPVISDS